MIGRSRREALSRLVRHMDAAEVDAIAAAFVEVPVDAGQVVLADGGANDALWVVAEGACAVDARVDGQALHLDDLGPGAVFGELSLFTLAPAAAEVRATAPSTLLRLGPVGLEELCHRSPGAELALVRALVEDLAVRVRECSTALGAPERKRRFFAGTLARLLRGLR